MSLGSLVIIAIAGLTAALILAGVAVAHLTISRWRRQMEEAEAWQQRYESLYEEQTERCRKLLAVNTELRYQNHELRYHLVQRVNTLAAVTRWRVWLN